MQILLGLGGNAGDVKKAFSFCVAELDRRYPVRAVSRLWHSAPVGPPQANYLNAAMVLDLDAPLKQLLALCQALEAAAGRNRQQEQRWGPRPLDIDLLMAPGVVVDSPHLVLPHPRFHCRRFALLPACELVPQWIHPRQRRSLVNLLADLDAHTQPCHPAGALVCESRRFSRPR